MDTLPVALSGLASYTQFFIYELVPSQTRLGKNDKLPINYLTGKQLAQWNSPKNWIDAQTALTAAKLYGPRYGVGFVFTENDPFFFIDIDNCLDITGQWSLIAQQLCSTFMGAATEVSSSHKGLHIIGTYQKPIKEHACRNKPLNIELYTYNHFIALTGLNTQGSVNYECTKQLNDLIEGHFNKTPTAQFHWSFEPVADWNGPLDDHELISRALNSLSAAGAFGHKATFRDLWYADIHKLAQIYNGDESSYDAALAQHLAFWTGNNCERMLRLMKQSKLVREKWNREDYLPRTILSACSKQTRWLQDKPVIIDSPVQSQTIIQLINGSRFLTIEDQQKLFQGCVYICDAHKVLVPGGSILRSDQFRVRYGGYSFPMDTANERTTRNAWEAFTESQAIITPRVDGSCFRPDLRPAEIITLNSKMYVNIYWPVVIIRKVGDASPFLKHLEKLVPDERDRTILLSYIAALVQYKGKKFKWAPLLQGVDGNGKSLITKCVAHAIGLQYTHYPKSKELTERFNGWMYEKILIGIEDIDVSASRREVYEALKPMITNEYLEIEQKGQDKVTRNICCNFIINTNHKEGLRKTVNDRRFAPFYTPQQQEDDLIKWGMTSEYFMNLFNWLDNQDGYAIVAELLYTFPIPSEFNPATFCQRAPLTTSTQDAIMHGLGPIEQEILEAIDEERLGFKGGWISSLQLDSLLKQHNLIRQLSHQRRHDLLVSMGYVRHPHLLGGRVNNIVMPDGGKPRLYIRKDRSELKLTVGAEIAKAYTDAQMRS